MLYYYKFVLMMVANNLFQIDVREDQSLSDGRIPLKTRVRGY